MNLWQNITKLGKGAEIIKNWLGSGGVTVSQEQAQSRANVCLQCPMNSDGHAFTEGLANAIKDHIEFKNTHGLRVEGEKSLHTCKICLCALRLKVWCPTELLERRMTREEFEQYPGNCWLDSELNKKNEPKNISSGPIL